MPEGFSTTAYYHGTDAAAGYGERYGHPVLHVGNEHDAPAIQLMSYPGASAEDHARFARDLASAADEYAWHLTGIAGDPQAGADFWGSIDTCADDCGGRS